MIKYRNQMNIPLFCYKEKGKLFLFLYFVSIWYSREDLYYVCP